MCKYEVLARNENGFVTRCRHCGCFNVAFGNLSLSQYEGELRSFCQLVQRYKRTWRKRTASNVKEIRIDTPMPNFQLLFCYQELLELNDLLTRAVLILDAQAAKN